MLIMMFSNIRLFVAFLFICFILALWITRLLLNGIMIKTKIISHPVEAPASTGVAWIFFLVLINKIIRLYLVSNSKNENKSRII